jgi:hypothetical protein
MLLISGKVKSASENQNKFSLRQTGTTGNSRMARMHVVPVVR